jgi:hypothetical protein
MVVPVMFAVIHLGSIQCIKHAVQVPSARQQSAIYPLGCCIQPRNMRAIFGRLFSSSTTFLGRWGALPEQLHIQPDANYIGS